MASTRVRVRDERCGINACGSNVPVRALWEGERPTLYLFSVRSPAFRRDVLTPSVQEWLQFDFIPAQAA